MSRTSDHEAVVLRDAFCSCDGVPEGIELFRWIWVAQRLGPLVRIPTLPDRPATLAAFMPEPPRFGVLEIRAQYFWRPGYGDPEAMVGIDANNRTAVLWYAEGGQFPDRDEPRHAIDDLAREGDAILGRESMDRFSDKLLRLLELLDEGEEWKRES